MSDSPKSPPRLKDRLEALVQEMLEKGILFDEAVSHFEKNYLQKALKNQHGHITRTAESIGLHRNTLSHKLQRYDLL